MSTTTNFILDSGNDADPTWLLHLDAGAGIMRAAARAPRLPRAVEVDGVRYVPNGYAQTRAGGMSYSFVRAA